MLVRLEESAFDRFTVERVMFELITLEFSMTDASAWLEVRLLLVIVAFSAFPRLSVDEVMLDAVTVKLVMDDRFEIIHIIEEFSRVERSTAEELTMVALTLLERTVRFPAVDLFRVESRTVQFERVVLMRIDLFTMQERTNDPVPDMFWTVELRIVLDWIDEFTTLEVLIRELLALDSLIFTKKIEVFVMAV